MIVYHYHGIIQESPGILKHIDGIATADRAVLSHGEYQQLKQHIADANSLDVAKFVITSLTPLGASK